MVGRLGEESRKDDGRDGRCDDCNGEDPSEEAGCIDPPYRPTRIYLTAWTGHSFIVFTAGEEGTGVCCNCFGFGCCVTKFTQVTEIGVDYYYVP